MTQLVLDLPTDLYERLQSEADQQGKSAQEIVQTWLAERLAWLQPAPPGERERAIEALRAAGLLAELSPEEKQRASQSTMTLEEVHAALDRAGGRPLSEIILEMRGPKE
jgi:hypothetical protein